jgi:hypothetical protein
VFAGWDWATGSHDVTVVDAAGARTDRWALAHTEAGILGGFTASTAGQPLPSWPTSVDTALFQTGDWLYLDGGTLDLGVVRDSELNRRNRYQTFTETFEGTALIGAESLRVVFTGIDPTGEAQAPITVP